MSAASHPDLLRQLPARTARAWRCLPLQRSSSGAVEVAVTDSKNEELLANLKVLFGCEIRPQLRSAVELDELIREAYGHGAESLDQIQPSIGESSLSASTPLDETAMVKFVNDLIRRAQDEGATDIHIEPFEHSITIRFRVDGLLRPVPVPPSLIRFRSLLTARIKVMAQMNIAEKRLPQDGRIRFQKGESRFDIRVSTIPVPEGESINLRLLAPRRETRGLPELGMSDFHLQMLRRHIAKPSGLILVTGPTGHGKTTTLYAALSEINQPEKKIITVEDPIEYRLAGLNQIQVHSKIGLTFSHGLRSILRQDPDVIMVGEIRDAETAEIAVRAALTGHLVFSTLHTIDAAGAIVRLIDMGIEPHLVASSLSLIVAQRLFRTLCQTCQGRQKVSCTSCAGAGFKGRRGLFEFLPVTETFHEPIMRRANAAELRQLAESSGMTRLAVEGERLVRQGITTAEEMARVVDEVE